MKNAPIFLVFDDIGSLIDNVTTKDCQGENPYTEMMFNLNSDNVPGVLVSVVSSHTYHKDILLASLTRTELQDGQQEVSLRPPFTDFVYDVFEKPIKSGPVTLGDVCDPKFMSQYGRPM